MSTTLTPAHTNRLVTCSSPYLLQHAHNPVDWYPWGPEALARARSQDLPIFLSVGYSACHWCHVMEKLCFEVPTIAAVMNRNFVNIKVDREERPDLDETYMLATQMMTGSGGWPMSVWLTPDLKPFYAGTYFPPEDGYGRPGFPRLLEAIAEAWRQRRGEIEAQAQRAVEALQVYADKASAPGAAPLDLPAVMQLAYGQWGQSFDPEHGGFGGAPKFPPHQTLRLWCWLLEHTATNPAQLQPAQFSQLTEMLTVTLDALQAGGIHDQLAGGFARYSVDAQWLVPHFEKMLYDNAQLLEVFARAGRLLDRPDYLATARACADYWLREMTGPAGEFHATIDADSEGHEGKYYAYTPAEVRAALGQPADADLLCTYYGITESGNFEGSNVLSRVMSVAQLAERSGLTVVAGTERIIALTLRLRQHRQSRVPPARDDKIITAWNGMLIQALVTAGRACAQSDYLDVARNNARFLLRQHYHAGQLYRISRHAPAHTLGFLDDYAHLIAALAYLSAVSPADKDEFLPVALHLLQDMDRLFWSANRQTYTATHAGHDVLPVQLQLAMDNAVPAALAVALEALGVLLPQTVLPELAQHQLEIIGRLTPVASANPTVYCSLWYALLSSGLPAGATTPGPAVTFTASAKVAAGSPQDVTLTLVCDIPTGWSLQLVPPNESAIRFDSDNISAVVWACPPAPDHGYTGTLTIHGTGRWTGGSLEAWVTYQLCGAETCLPEVTVAVSVPLAPGGGG